MRTFYIFLNIFLFVLAALLLTLNFSFKPRPPDKVLSQAPVLNDNVQSSRKMKGVREEIPDIASLWENNLFSPYRSGEGGSLLGAAKPTGLELLGVCTFGDVSGAIIFDKQSSAAVAPQPGRLRARGTVAPGGAAALAPKFYKLGEQLENGFTLSEINSDSVVLSRGREQLVLKLEFEGEASISRNAAAAEAAAAANAAIKIEQPPQNVQPETAEAPQGTPGVPVVPGVPPVPGAAGAPGVRPGTDNTAVLGTVVTPPATVAPGTAQGVMPRAPAPLSRRQRQPQSSNPPNAQ